MKIVIICGGISTERNVSISSGELIFDALVKNNHTVVLVDAYLGVKEIPTDIFLENYNLVNKCNFDKKEVPNIKKIKEERFEATCGKFAKEEFFGPNVIKMCRLADITFVAMHGSEGENGKVQAYLDMMSIKYTGSGYVASILGMNKHLTKAILDSKQILNAKNIVVKNIDNIDEIITSSKEKIGFPCVTKPATGGSSIGVSIVEDESGLYLAIKQAAMYDDTILIEEYIEGVEVSVGVINNVALPPIEIVPKSNEFYNYENKYTAGKVDEICPARLDEQTIDKLQVIAQQVCQALAIQVYARVDFIVNTKGECYCLEANTLPGMTPTSLLPQEALTLGITYEELCEKIITESLKKYVDMEKSNGKI